MAYDNVFDFVKSGDYPSVGVDGGLTHTVKLAPDTRNQLFMALFVYLAGKALKVW